MSHHAMGIEIEMASAMVGHTKPSFLLPHVATDI